MKVRGRSWRLAITALMVLTLSALGVGATASSGTHVRASGLSVEVSASGHGTDCNYWSSVGAFQTEGEDDYVYYQVAYATDSGLVWHSGNMFLPDVLAGGPGRATLRVAADELTVDVVLTPNGQFSTEVSGRIEERQGFGAFVAAFNGHRTQDSADAVGTFAINGWEPPVCDTSNSVGGWIGTERGMHTHR